MKTDNNWKDLESFFASLNATCNYVVLRNYEDMDSPQFFCDGHEDIDILCEDFKQFMEASKASPLYNNDNVHLEVTLANRHIPIDLRCVGDGYYDSQWERDILSTRKSIGTDQGTWYVMSDDNYYFSLVYHAFLQKKQVSPDYDLRLRSMSIDLGSEADTAEKHLCSLFHFMRDKRYHIVYPEDISVPINTYLVPRDLVHGEIVAWKNGRKIEKPISARIKLCNAVGKCIDVFKNFLSGGRKSAFHVAIITSILLHWNLLYSGSEYTKYAGLNGLIPFGFLLCIGLTAALFVDIYSIKKSINACLWGVGLAAFPILTQLLIRDREAIIIFPSIFLVTFGIRLFQSNRRGILIPGILFVLVGFLLYPRNMYLFAVLLSTKFFVSICLGEGKLATRLKRLPVFPYITVFICLFAGILCTVNVCTWFDGLAIVLIMILVYLLNYSKKYQNQDFQYILVILSTITIDLYFYVTTLLLNTANIGL